MTQSPAARGGRFAGVFACLILFASLAAWVETGAAQAFDLFVRTAVHRAASPGLTAVMHSVTLLGSTLVLAMICAIGVAVLYRAGRPHAAWMLAASLAGALVLENAVKYTFHRARPEAFYGVLPASYSFPSGHALLSFCVYVMLARICTEQWRRRTHRVLGWTVALVLIASIGVSRVYLGVHYPTDVIAGYIVGAFWISVLWAVRR